MKLKFTALVLAVCLTLCGCASLLERSYSSVEPYTDRYFDSGAEDTLKAESYQDLVNSLLILIEQRREEVVIRYYAPEGTDTYTQALNAKLEVKNETLLGSYLLDTLTLTYTGNVGYCTLTYSMSYRADAQDISSLMALSDSQSLVDLLRLAVREGHTSITAHFISKMSREEVLRAVDTLWQELYLDELEKSGFFDPPVDLKDTEEDVPSDETISPDDTLPSDEPDSEVNDQQEQDVQNNTEPPEDGETIPDGGDVPLPDPQPVIEFPPCPWQIIFYPNAETAEIVTIVLK